MLAHIRKAVQKVQNEKGQGLVEYALILVLIAVVVITALKTTGNGTVNTFNKINAEVAKPAPAP